MGIAMGTATFQGTPELNGLASNLLFTGLHRELVNMSGDTDQDLGSLLEQDRIKHGGVWVQLIEQDLLLLHIDDTLIQEIVL